MTYDIETTAAIIRTLLALAALIAVVRFMLLPTLTDQFRQQLFEIRRDMFLLVADGLLEPAHPAYVTVRRTINGLLQNAEHLSFTKLLLSEAVSRTAGRHRREKLDASIASIRNEVARKTLHLADKAVTSAIVRHTTIQSPVAYIMLMGVGLAVLVRLLTRGQEEVVVVSVGGKQLEAAHTDEDVPSYLENTDEKLHADQTPTTTTVRHVKRLALEGVRGQFRKAVHRRVPTDGLQAEVSLLAAA